MLHWIGSMYVLVSTEFDGSTSAFELKNIAVEPTKQTQENGLIQVDSQLWDYQTCPYALFIFESKSNESI